MKPAAIICAAAMAVLLARTAPAQDSKTPAEWTAQLGAERLPDREAASAALLKLGAKARDDVRHALDSTDPEVKSRARELWKTLRWLVVPDADEDIEAHVFTIAEAKAMAARGEIIDLKTAYGLTLI